MLSLQTVYSQSLEVTYHTDYALNAAEPNKISGDQLVLNINGNTSEFYSIFREKLNALVTEMEKKGASYDEYLKEKSNYAPSSIFFKVYKNLPQKNQLTFTDRFMSNNYKYIEPMEKPQWMTKKETKEIIGYTCQKATTHFRGRTWTAWYTTNIPVQEGPWKLWGLPGLILEAYDTDSLYRFVAIGIKNTTTNKIVLNQKQYINCSRDEYMKQKNNFEENPIAALNSTKDAGITITDESGKTIIPKRLKYIDIEIDEK